MLSVNGISAWIEVDGKELEQYGVEEELNQSRATCWIATQAGKCFSIVFRDDAKCRDHSLGSILQLDGSPIRGKVLRSPADILNRAPDRTVVQKDQVLSATSSRPFMFAKLELTDDDEYLDRASTHLGEIRIHVYRVQALGSYLVESDSSTHGHGKIHERSKKAITLCVSYGKEMKTTTQHSCRVVYLDGNIPLATFTFKYRDFGLLQANGIIPRLPPTKKKPVASKDFLDLTTGNNVKPDPADGIEIIDSAVRRRTAALPSKRLNSGQEREVQPPKRIKREKNFVPNGEVIDLT